MTDKTKDKTLNAYGKPDLFPLGQLVATRHAAAVIDRFEMIDAIRRHQSGDWGDCCSDDWTSNDEALTVGLRIFSVYHTTNGVKFWIITEADRSVTTVLLPDDY
jgi:hypothetical protein